MERQKSIFFEYKTPFQKTAKLVAFFKGNQFTDCTFIVDGVEVKAHKLILACCSPVFEKMLFGEMASNEVIISDISLEEFREMLEFIYAENIYCTSVPHAWSLFYIANKYLLDDLISVCFDYINRNLTMSSLVLSYEYADMYNLAELKHKCFANIKNYLKGVFLSDYHMKPGTLADILQQGPFNLSYFELVVRILQWGALQCKILELPVVPSNIIQVLKKYDFLKYVKKDCLLNLKCSYCEEPVDICQCSGELIHETLVLLDDILNLPDDTTSDFPQITTAAAAMLSACRHRKMLKISGRVDLQDSEAFLSSISVNKKVIFFAFLVTTQMKPREISKDCYQGAITIRVCEQNSKTSLVKATTVSGDILYDSEYYVQLNNLVVLQPNITYDVRISYRNFNSPGQESPIHCYYMSNKLHNQSKDTTISFFEMFGSVVKGISFFPA